MRTWKKVISVLLSLSLMLSLCVMGASATGATEVTNAAELIAALNSAEVEEITLTDNIEMSEVWTPVVIESGRTLVINGGGHTISGMVVETGVLLPSGSGVPGDGGSCDYYAGFIGNNKGTLTINDLTFDDADVDIKPVTESLSSTGSSILAVVCANNTGTLVYNNVSVDSSTVKGYTKVGLLHGFTQSGSFAANHCAISNSNVVLEADGTDPEAAFSGVIIGYDGTSRARTNGIKLSNNTISIDNTTVKQENWASAATTAADGTVYTGSWGLTSPTYTHGSSAMTSVHFAAEVDGYQYETLADAIAAAGNETVKLTDNVALTETLNITKDVTIDLNGCNITGDNTRVFAVKAGTLTFDGKGTVSNHLSTASASSAIRVSGDAGAAGLVVGKDVIVSTDSCYAISIFGPKDNAKTLTVNGTVITTSTIVHDSSAIAGNGAAGSGNTNITINEGAVVTAANDAAIYHPQVGTLTVNGGKITGVSGIEAKAGTVVIKNGDIKATGTAAHNASNGTSSTTGYAVALVENANYGKDAVSDAAFTVTIENGTFTGTVAKLTDSERTGDETISITGGTFSVDPSTYVSTGYATAFEESNYVVKTVQTAYAPTIDLSQSRGVTLDGTTLTGNVDTRTFAVTDSNIHTLFESILSDGTGPWTVKDGKNLTFATIKFTGLADDAYYTVQQVNPALAYAYSETDFPDSTKTRTYTGADLKDGLVFPISSESGAVSFKIQKANTVDGTELTNAATYTYTNAVTFSASGAPTENAPVVEVVPSITATTATAAVEATTVADAIENAAAAPTKALEIVATSGSSTVTEANVTLNAGTVAALVDGEETPTAKVDTVDIKTDVGTISLSSSAIEAIAADNNVQTSGATIQAEQITAEDGSPAIVITVKAGDNDVEISDLEKPITFSFYIGTGKVNPVLLYVDTSDGRKLKNIQNSSYDPETGIITGTTTHLTEFVAVDPMTTVPGGIGQKVTLTPNNTTEDYLTIQVTFGGANSIYTVKATTAVEIYVANGTVLNVWETTALPTFEAGSFVPNSNPTILVNSATITAAS